MEKLEVQVMKNKSLLNILAVLALLAIFALIAWVAIVFNNPYSMLNPFPPPVLPDLIVLPTATNTPYLLPATWTPTPLGTQASYRLTLTPPSFEETTPVAFSTTTPFPTLTPFVTLATVSNIAPPNSVAPTKTVMPTSKTPAATPTKTAMPNVSAVTERSGTKSGVWQKTNGDPIFLFNVSKNMFAYAVYFGIDPNGGERSQDKDGVTYEWIEIRHDAKQVELRPGIPSECGTFYLRLKIRYANAPAPGGQVTYSESNWKTVFTFNYDPVSPIAPWFANIGVTGVNRGIQNKSADPKFDLSWVEGVLVHDASWDGKNINEVILAGDYSLAPDYNESKEWVLRPVKCSGVKGYYIYWGQDINGVNNSKFNTSPIFDPAKIPANTPYFLRVKTMDNLGNVSDWKLVAMDEDYDPLSGLLPSAEQAVFYYDTVIPNNLTNIAVDNGVISNTTWTSDDRPTFTFSGGEDPIGFRTDVLYGYQVIWSTDPNAKPVFISYDDMGNSYTPNIGKSGTYFLKIRAVDWAGNPSKEWLTFIYKFDNVGPAGVTKVTEVGGIPNNTFQNASGDTSFTWTTTNSDPGDSKTSSGPVTGYWVYWGDDPNADYGLFTYQTAMSFDPPAMPTGIYYLRIATFDNAGNFTITTPYTLKYDNLPPTPPTSAVEETGTKKTPRFTWNGAADEGSGIAGYYVYFGQDPLGTSTKFVTTAKYSITLETKAIYYLRVQVKDNAGNLSDWVTLYTHDYN
jgi:hypothetical protein